MRAALLRDLGRLSIENDVALDSPGPHEVLVDTAAVGVCHSDLHFIDGLWSAPLPTILGHEMSGVVRQTGSLVTDFAPGDHVVGCLTPFCGRCEYCLAGRMALCRDPSLQRQIGDRPRIRATDGPVNQFVNLSAFAEQILAHEHALVKIPPEVPLMSAAIVGCAVLTGVGAVIHTAVVRPGDSVAVVGCGGVGLNVVQGARLSGARQIIAVDRSEGALEMAARLGATDTILASSSDLSGAVLRVAGDGVDHAFEAIGAKATVESAWRMLRRGGTVTVVGMLPHGVSVEIPGVDFIDEKRLQGSNMGSNRFRTDVPRYLDFYRRGLLELDGLVTRRYCLDDIDQAVDDLRAGGSGRGLITFAPCEAG